MSLDSNEFLRCLCECLNELRYMRRYVFRCDDVVNGGTITITEKRSPTNCYRGIVYMYGTMLTHFNEGLSSRCDIGDPKTDPVAFVVRCLEKNT